MSAQGARTRRRRARVLVASGVALLSHVAGCRTWQTMPPPNAHPEGYATYGRARVVLRDSTRMELRDVVVRPDSVIGRAGPSTRVAITQQRVARVETQHVSMKRTLGMVGGAVVVYSVAAVVALAFLLKNWSAAPAPGVP